MRIGRAAAAGYEQKILTPISERGETELARHTSDMRALVSLVAAWGMHLATAPAAPVFRVSVSVSPFVETVFRTGTRFTDGTLTATSAEELQRLFVSHRANEVDARISM